LRPGSPGPGLRRGRLPEPRGPDRRRPGGEHLHREERDPAITKDDLLGADEIFFTGTAVEVVPIVKILDGSNGAASKTSHVIGAGATGSITQKIRKTYLDVVSGRVPKYEKWLSYVNE
jgi:hypothetical protein